MRERGSVWQREHKTPKSETHPSPGRSDESVREELEKCSHRQLKRSHVADFILSLPTEAISTVLSGRLQAVEPGRDELVKMRPPIGRWWCRWWQPRHKPERLKRVNGGGCTWRATSCSWPSTLLKASKRSMDIERWLVTGLLDGSSHYSSPARRIRQWVRNKRNWC